MGSCTSATSKKREKAIISNALKNKNQTSNTPINEQNKTPNSLSILISKIKNDNNSDNQNKTPITIGQNMTFKELFIQLKININSDYEIQLKEGQIINNFDINNKIIETIYPYIKNNLNDIININLIYNGLEISDNLIDSYSKLNTIIGSPIFDNPDFFAIVIFNTKNNEIKLFYREPKDPEFVLMNKFNSFTAYCNAKGNLYISGGENESGEELDNNNNNTDNNSELNNFFSIDLNSLNCSDNNNFINQSHILDERNIENDNLNRNDLISKDYNDNDIKKYNFKQLPNLLEPRTWHSMIFVPEKYIFIVGGSTKSVEIYDIENNIINKDSTLNELRNECTLCMVNNTYLYAFCGFHLHQTFNCTVEKCNLRKKERKWNFVKFNQKENLGFIPSFFAVSYYKNDNIVLIGGDSIEEINNSYIIKIGENENDYDEINEFNLGEKKFGVFRDKFFTPIDNNYSVNIPLVYGEHVQLLFLNMYSGEIEQKEYNDLFNKEE